MNKLKMVFYGFLVWLIPTGVTAILTFSPSNAKDLFDVVSAMIIAISVFIFSYLYFKDINAEFFKEGVTIGITWLILTVILDVILILVGISKISLISYAYLVVPLYIIIPAITIGYGLYNDQKEREAHMID